jgi:hypothetical protein
MRMVEEMAHTVEASRVQAAERREQDGISVREWESAVVKERELLVAVQDRESEARRQVEVLKIEVRDLEERCVNQAGHVAVAEEQEKQAVQRADVLEATVKQLKEALQKEQELVAIAEQKQIDATEEAVRMHLNVAAQVEVLTEQLQAAREEVGHLAKREEEARTEALALQQALNAGGGEELRACREELDDCAARLDACKEELAACQEKLVAATRDGAKRGQESPSWEDAKENSIVAFDRFVASVMHQEILGAGGVEPGFMLSPIEAGHCTERPQASRRRSAVCFKSPPSSLPGQLLQGGTGNSALSKRVAAWMRDIEARCNAEVIYTYIYIYIYTHTRICTHTYYKKFQIRRRRGRCHTYTHTHTHTHIQKHTHTYILTHTNMHILQIDFEQGGGETGACLAAS